MLAIVEQQPEHESLVAEFNARLRAGGSAMQFPLPSAPLQGADSPEYAIDIRRYLALEGDFVRGGYILSRHGVRSQARPFSVHLIQLPLSEGVVNPSFAPLGFLLVKDAFSKAPLLYGLGMGGLQMPLPRLLHVLGFRLHPVPFYFRIVNAREFLRNIQPPRARPARGRLLDAAAWMPLVPQSVRLFHALRASARLPKDTCIDLVPDFGPWADELWEIAAAPYSLISVRDAATLNYRLRVGDQRLRRIRVRRGSRLCGWAVVADSQFENHRQFGAMRVGTIVDTLSLPGEEETVATAATDYLCQSGVDLMVSNQCALPWRNALERNGFLRHDTNFVFAAAPALASRIDAAGGLNHVQMNRCDGDGPIHL